MRTASACRIESSPIFFAYDEKTRSWVNESDRFVVIAAKQTNRGDVTLGLANGYAILLFPASGEHEAWRFFASGRGRHLVFPTEESDYAISRRKPVDTSQWGGVAEGD